MGYLRFRRRIRVAPGIHLNLSKSGPSVSFGRRGVHYTVGHGRRRTTLGIPGTGVSYTTIHTQRSGRRAGHKAHQVGAARPARFAHTHHRSFLARLFGSAHVGPLHGARDQVSSLAPPHRATSRPVMPPEYPPVALAPVPSVEVILPLSAGWYPDPLNPHHFRWWNGVQWTPYVG